ncbi:site-specific DNA-methyltransferase [uncultured Fibrobacter sp.]|uniref:site-specific DNA-methyltransferase n=1 Tax=uncultured Fibrobacter sp. TaxID=261512 RepID=UPI0025D95075|nr:site-specific DNA-methyltransferase [uncultured Fibrobacter sp.]
MEKANMHSLDMVNENIKKIGNLFPECVTETVDENGNVKAAIDFEKLQENLSHATIGEGEERYQFTWPGKREAIHNANASTNMTLRPCKAESVDFDNTENLYIEGDNLEVLKLLQENYLGKVKMIYIDPPYNTGNDFVYNDDFKEDTESFQSKSGMYDEDGNMLLQNFEKNTESNGRFHTDWLNMMYPRLKIARNLLSDDGVIFISIDDNEVENLKKICDEIFGEQNFVADIIWKRKRGRDNSARWFSKAHEYCLLFAKNKEKFNTGYLELDEETKSAYKNPDNDPRGNYRMLGCWARGTQGGVKYDFTTKDGTYFKERLWLFSKDNLKKLDDDDKLIIRGDNIYRKMFIYENKGKIPETLWDDVSNAANASDEIKRLFDEIVFDTPKPTPYIKRMIEIASSTDSLILDFFSGSATTANAVLTQNMFDGGKRKFICVQLPEATAEDSEANKAGYKNICEIGKERIRRAGKKIKEEFGEKAKDLDIGFRVLKLAKSNMKDVYYSPAETDSADIFDANNVKEDRTPLDLLFQVMPECNLPLSSKIEERTIEGKTVYFVNGNYLVACFDEGITEKLIKSVIDVPDSDKPYYFYMRGLGLESDKVLDNFEQLFVHYSPTTKRKVI